MSEQVTVRPMARTFTERALETRKLERWTQVYRDKPDLFRRFERAEDPEGRAAVALAELSALAGQRVLEIGCGTGWLTRHIAESAGTYVAVEPKSEMLDHAGDLSPAHVLRARGEFLPFPAGCFDRIVMSWVLLDLRPKVRERLLAECERVLDPQSSGPGKPGIWVVENANSGDFQALRNMVDDEGLGELSPLVEQHGFVPVKTVATTLRFENEAEALRVLSAILGSQVAAQLQADPRGQMGLDLCVLARE
ncbi:MAG: ubiquinone/menaquinone biosynthesis C-methylase UbiE [Planctomycetota bacterium]|jgi:ubiquinone/menaquinone biosynthesis C-methylase UbiE